MINATCFVLTRSHERQRVDACEAGREEVHPLAGARGYIAAFLLLAIFVCGVTPGHIAAADTGALAGVRHRVVVSTDVGGTDPDDFQSMVHLLAYADVFDLEGLISSPYGPGRKQHILEVLAHYERDYRNLKTHSARYPAPDALRAMTKQGAIDDPGIAGVGRATEGSEWIIRCARREDARPLWVLVWGGIEDLAQALHDAPDIESKLRVYFIGGPNKKWSANAYEYIARQHPRLWIIESNSTYRGWFVGGNQAGEWGNTAFVTTHVAPHGALGGFFGTLLKGVMKMGDTPSVSYLLRGTPEDPSQPGWGGRYVRAWERPRLTLNRLPEATDRMEEFGVLTISLPPGHGVERTGGAFFVIENQTLPGHLDERGVLHFRFSAKSAQTWRYSIQAPGTKLDGHAGTFVTVRAGPERAAQPSPHYPNWWTDDPRPDAAEGAHNGARTVSRWREAFLTDFAARMRRCSEPARMPRS